MKDELIELIYKKPKKTTGFSRLDSLDRLGNSYVSNVVAYVSKSKILDPYTNQEVDPDEKFMRSVEEQANIHEAGVDDFRRQITTQIGVAHVRGGKFKWDDNPHVFKAVQKKLEKDMGFKRVKVLTGSANQRIMEMREMREMTEATPFRPADNYMELSKPEIVGHSDVIDSKLTKRELDNLTAFLGIWPRTR